MHSCSSLTFNIRINFSSDIRKELNIAGKKEEKVHADTQKLAQLGLNPSWRSFSFGGVTNNLLSNQVRMDTTRGYK